MTRLKKGFYSSKIRVVIPDSHGSYIDPEASACFLQDLKILSPQEIVFLGDNVDCGGDFSEHPKQYIEELEYSYADDCAAANDFLDKVQKAVPKARDVHYISGNHEFRIERWAAKNIKNSKDAATAANVLSPQVQLKLKDRGIKYYRMGECYSNLTVPGTIKLGKCYFTHGFSAAKFAAAVHLQRYGNNIVFGHVHRIQEYIANTVDNGVIGSWTPGTLAKLQPYYLHTNPSDHAHGYGLQSLDRNGYFFHLNIPIIKGRSMLRVLLGG